MGIALRNRAVVIALLAGVLLAGCGGDDSTDAPITLRIGTDSVQGKPDSRQIEELARRVETLLNGRLRIRPAWHAAGDGPDWDQRVARMVMSGKLDMGLIPSRAWDTEGVTSLQALSAPFLITSDELVAEVVSGGLSDELLSGLDQVGVVGLALLPDGLRHPFGLQKPLLGPGDYAGKAIRTPTSATTTEVFEALGATVSDDDPDARLYAGVDSSYNLEPPGTATGNVTFFPKVNSLVVNQDALDRLDAGRRDIIEKAAAQTRAWAIDVNGTDAAQAQRFCDKGSGIVLASRADVAALERATRPVTAELERDAQTRTIIEAIRGLKRRVDVAVAAPAACAPDDDRAGTRPKGTSELDGVYRYETTDEHLRRAGVTDPGKIAENHGVTTQTMKDGEWCFVQDAPNALENPADCNPYAIDGDRVIFSHPSGKPDVFRFKKLANGDLKLTLVSAQPGDEEVVAAFAIPVWKRIGDAE